MYSNSYNISGASSQYSESKTVPDSNSPQPMRKETVKCPTKASVCGGSPPPSFSQNNPHLTPVCPFKLVSGLPWTDVLGQHGSAV